ncbi:uncharacterized protein [Pyrus communis]|uniref:uncharacterized protein n=1 Tax=Pyrus communis TaxID=23211 RepID=UPI0035C1B50D
MGRPFPPASQILLASSVSLTHDTDGLASVLSSSRLRRLTPPFPVSGILKSSSSHARLWPSQLKPKRVSVLRKSTKKEEPVLEGLLKQYFDDDLINPQLITMYGATNDFGQGTRDTHPLTLWARVPVGSALLSPQTAVLSSIITMHMEDNPEPV